MSNNIKYAALAALSLAGGASLGSCSDDFLEVTPPDKATLEEYYNNYDHILEALVATYNPMRSYDWNNSQYAPLTLCADAMADDIWIGGSGVSDNQHLHKMFNFTSTQNSSDCLTGIWDQSYKGVRNANDVITYVGWAADRLTDEQAAELTAEAKLLRAFYYNLLWKYYGNIPFYTTNLTSPYIGEQKGHDEVYAAVIADLEEVIGAGVLPMRWDSDNIGRMSQATAAMLYAEMVMYQEDDSRYAKALALMEDVISSGEYELAPDYSTIFLESGEWNSESIFEICYKDDNAVRSWGDGYLNAGGTIYPRLIGPSGGVAADGVDNGWGFEPLRAEVYDLFEEGDARRDATFYDARSADYTKRYQDTGFWLKKYLPYSVNNADQNADGDLNFNNNLRIYRYAETLLNAAELIVRTGGDLAKAQDYLNKVHHRAGLDDNRAATIDNILAEKRLEFVGEGKRYWDLVRTGNASSALVPDEYGYRTNTWTPSKKYLPIPLSEIDASQGALQQNNY